MPDLAIKVENLSKRYRVGLKEELHDTLGRALASWVKAPVSNFRRLRKLSRFDEDGDTEDVIWALKDVSFEVKHSEVVGIIGRNGAGKSTLLKIISRITEPTSGRVLINGRVSSLLEVGTGFHPELTGRENVYLNGTVLGMSKGEVDRKFDEIVAFAEVEKFIDTPVKRYSSGMQVRLAFAVAAHLEPEILLVDEVLAVGDAAFQKKCMGKMGDVAREGRTVLFVSHNMGAISRLCSRAILLNDGSIVLDATAAQAVDRYYDLLQLHQNQSLLKRTDRKGTGEVLIRDVCFYDESKRSLKLLRSGRTCYIGIQYEIRAPISPPNISFALSFFHRGVHFFSLGSRLLDTQFENLPPLGEVFCRINKLPLSPGLYEFAVICRVGSAIADWIRDAGQITVEAGDFFGTGRLPPRYHPGLLVPHSWSTTFATKSERET